MSSPRTLFLTVCIPARIGIAALPVLVHKKHLPYLGAVLLTIGLGFQWLFWTNSRMTAPEAGGPVWWHNLRVVHGMNFILAGAFALKHKREAWIPLAVDVVLGIMAHVNHYN